jgi:hypothetical protein
MKIQILIAISILINLCGCAAYRPYTGAERTLMGAAISMQALDVVTTSYALSQPGFSEGNAIWWGEDNGAILGGMLASKIVFCGVAYLAGQAWPNSRMWTWGILGGGGAAASGWNLYQVIGQ